MSTKTNVILIIVSSLLILSPLIAMVVIHLIPDGAVPYDFVSQFLFFDHISYNGEDYYLLDSDNSISDNLVPDTSKKLQVTLVNSQGEAYDGEKTEECWGVANDEACNYIYYYATGIYFTNIKDQSILQ